MIHKHFCTLLLARVLFFILTLLLYCDFGFKKIAGVELMDLADAIIAEIEKPEDEFSRLRRCVVNKKSLPRVEFSKLVKLLETDPLGVVDSGEFTAGEMHLVEKAIKRAKISNPDSVLLQLVRDNTKKAPVLLCALLSKGCTIRRSEALGAYLEEMIQRDMLLCHYKLLLAVSKNYPRTITAQIFEFCKASKHPICRSICKNLMVENE